MRRILTTAAGAATVLALTATPVLAHPHDRAHNGAVGPGETPMTQSGGRAAVAHQGIQCAFNNGNKHLSDLGLPCPADAD